MGNRGRCRELDSGGRRHADRQFHWPTSDFVCRRQTAIWCLMISVQAQKSQVLPWDIEFDNLFAGFVLFLSSGAFLWLLRSQASLTSGSRTGELSTDVLWGAVYVVSGYRILRQKRRIEIKPKIPAILIVLYVYICVSMIWSDAPGLTAMKLVALLGGAVFAFY